MQEWVLQPAGFPARGVARIFRTTSATRSVMNNPNDSTTRSFGSRIPGSVQSFFCPSCEVPLHYEGSYATDSSEGLVDFSDYYRCPAGCGTFEYERHRHRLRLVEPGYATGDSGV